jgi:hypothetical protein
MYYDRGAGRAGAVCAAAACSERPPRAGALTIGFWQNKNGQGILKAGASTAGVCNSGTWLRQYAPFQDLNLLEDHGQERDAMSVKDTSQLELDSIEAHQQNTPPQIEQVIERIGERYITDLRMLSEEFHRFYTAQLTAKDEQIAELSQRVEATERERDALEARLHELRRASERYLADLHTLSGEFGRHEGDRDASETRNPGEAE